ncbi:peptide ligase PGM1-related protein [Oryzobacter telluris]|uniref:peptide ligase PGM1-related protein n=1 Tax=Oryzobacter telluris TaxID=3149179 RepID=UPI00370D6B43
MTSETARPALVLRDLDDGARDAEFDRLQARLPEVWRGMRRDDPRESVVVVPSMSVDRVVSNPGTLSQALEERFLFLLLLLRQPRLRMVYVTSQPIDPLVVEYYLSLLPGVIPSHARSRLHLVSVGDGGPESLTEKLLARPRLLEQVRDLVPEPALSHLIPYTTTALERDLAIVLGIPMYGADPRLFELGTKTGCRRVFARAGVRHPSGHEDLHAREEVLAALVDLHRAGAREAMVKLNEGVSGKGNAVVDLTGVPAGGTPGHEDAVAERMQGMELEDERIDVDTFLAKLAQRGGIVEERVTGDEIRSPSVQLRVTPLGEVEVLSTHDQLLGGPSGQSYLGCRFPADPAYAVLITAAAERIGAVLAEEGVLGRFAVDFVTVRQGEAWEAHAIEVNIRRGGTTHPFLTLQFLTDGRYDPADGTFRTPAGEDRHLVATDHLEDECLKGLRLSDLFDLVARSGLHFDPSRQTGVVFHMMSALTTHGRLGMTAIGTTAEGAQALYEEAERRLLEEAAAALLDVTLPV